MLPSPYLARSLSSTQMAAGRAVSMTTGQAMTVWATSPLPWVKPSSSEQASPAQARGSWPDGSMRMACFGVGQDCELPPSLGVRSRVCPASSYPCPRTRSSIDSADTARQARGIDGYPNGCHSCSQRACPGAGEWGERVRRMESDMETFITICK